MTDQPQRLEWALQINEDNAQKEYIKYASKVAKIQEAIKNEE